MGMVGRIIPVLVVCASRGFGGLLGCWGERDGL